MALGRNLTKKELEEKKVEETPSSSSSTKEAMSEQAVELASNEDNAKQYCVFKSGSEYYGIPIELVKEVVISPKSSPVPQMPSYVTGMVNVRGNIYGVLDLRIFFQNEKVESDSVPYLLLLEHDEYHMGITIPGVPDTILVYESEIEDLPTSRLKSITGQKYLKGIIKKDKKMIILFDIMGMISGKKFAEIG